MKKTYIKPCIEFIETLTAPIMTVADSWGEKSEGSSIPTKPGGEGSELDSKENKGGWDTGDDWDW